MYSIPDHPDIARALSTGYGRAFRAVRCTSCRAEFTGDSPLYNYYGDILCRTCFRRSLLDDKNTDELADAFNIDKTTAFDVLERIGAG